MTRENHVRRIRLAACLVVTASIGCASTGSPDNGSPDTVWTRLGELTVTDRQNGDRFTVGAGRGEFGRIKLTVDRTSVDFDRVIVHFGSGTRQEISLRSTINAGSETRVIDLDGGQRIIRTVEFLYDANTIRGRTARVRLFGQR